MAVKALPGHGNTLTHKQSHIPAMSDSPFTIRFGLFMALLVSFLMPLILFSPLIIAKILNLSLIDKIDILADNFGVFILFSQAIGLFVSVFLIAMQLKKRNLSWASVGLKGFRTFQAVRYIAGYYLFLLSLLIVLAMVAMSLGIQDPPISSDEPGGSGMLRVMGGFWPTFALTVAVAPIVEELIFRGVLFPALQRRYGAFVGVTVSSLLFTLVHIDPLQMISVLPLGVYLAIMYQRTGSIYPGMILHATWNLMVLLIAQAAA